MEWYDEQCDHLDGKIIKFCKKDDNGVENPSSICYVDEYDYYTYDSDVDVKRFAIIKAKKKVNIIFLIVMIVLFAIVYPIAYWEAVNLIIYGAVIWYIFVYANRIIKSWVIMGLVTAILLIAYVIVIITLLLVTGVWYPLWVEIWAHSLAGFACYIAATAFIPKRGIMPRYLVGFMIGIIYELTEVFMFYVIHIPHLTYDPLNSIFDLFNHNTGMCIAILIEYLIRRKDRKHYDEAITHTDCL